MDSVIFFLPLVLILLAVVFRRWFVVVPAILSLGVYWSVGMITIAFATLHFGAYFLAWNLTLLGVALLLLRLVVRRRALIRIALVLMLSMPAAICCCRSYDWWTKERFAALENRVDWNDFKPFAPGNRLVQVEADESSRFVADEPVPVVSCAYALYPVGAAAVQALGSQESSPVVRPDSSPQAYSSLLGDGGTLVLALAPSADQMAAAEKNGLEYELTPVALDAFVFFVPTTNPVDSLTGEQVRGIYSGRIKSWRELGVDLDAKLVPYQRNKGSGSQTALERIMGEVPVVDPVKEDRRGGMGGIVSAVADYRNRPGAIGFSFRYYMEELVKEKNVKILKIDGVEPTVENIRSGAYPFIETAYVVTVGKRTENMRRLADFLVSSTGRELVDRTGYVAPNDCEKAKRVVR
ncbi:MAG: substrate-binding domain-containing protein [Kiritimatiellae bacterium]|nr:substrate-binding domain-containing protein [Kiritimatiellia bacterium]